MTALAAPVRQAVFLVGGRGTRLGELTSATPKPLLEVSSGLAFLDIVLENAARHGFSDIILLAGHFGDQIERRYQNRRIRNANVRVVREPEPSGTGGALVRVRHLLDDCFLLCNGDTLFDTNLRSFAADLPADALGKIALRRESDTGRYGIVRLHGDRILSFGEKIAAHFATGLMSCGLYLLRREIVDNLQLPSSLEADIFPVLAQQGRICGEIHDGYFLDMGLPETFEQAKREVPSRRRRPAAFLDRDGVLNVDVGYTHRPDQLIWVNNAAAAVRHLNDLGYYVFVVTNQAGVAKGLYDEAAVQVFHDNMQDELLRRGAHVDAFYYCPFHAEAVVERYRVADHPDRKPAPGMIRRAQQDWPIICDQSFLIGDQKSDLEAAEAVGIPGFLFDGRNLLDLVRSVTSRGSQSPLAFAR